MYPYDLKNLFIRELLFVQHVNLAERDLNHLKNFEANCHKIIAYMGQASHISEFTEPGMRLKGVVR